MSDTVIKIENVWKEYRYGAVSQQYLFRDMQSWWAKMRGKEDPNEKIAIAAKNIANRTQDVNANLPEKDSAFWALKNINLEIKKGEILGVIGRNGAGKSTLLKILSRVTAPTKGTINIKGHIGSLLEVGTGFHPELSGRENIFLNGAILGMRKHEIQSRFDEIVAFAEVEKFIDTPVKRYSSGMYVRLAFAVAAHLDPEILVVDEVLAVGDIEFQKKCLGKMGDVSKNEGKTVLLVSHNMEAVSRLCQRCILLRSGEILENDTTANVVGNYIQQDLKSTAHKKWDLQSVKQDDKVRFIEAFAHSEDGEIKYTFDITKPIGVTMTYEVLRDNQNFLAGLNVYNQSEVWVFSSHDLESGKEGNVRSKGVYQSTVWIPGNLLAEGMMRVGVALFRVSPNFEVYQMDDNTLVFNVVDYVRGDSAKGQYIGRFPGVIRPMLNWKTIKLP